MYLAISPLACHVLITSIEQKGLNVGQFTVSKRLGTGRRVFGSKEDSTCGDDRHVGIQSDERCIL